jgi:hypothetical protein
MPAKIGQGARHSEAKELSGIELGDDFRTPVGGDATN